MSDASVHDDDAFRAQALRLEFRIAAEAAQAAPGGDDAVRRDRGIVEAPHDVADRAVRAWTAGQLRDVTVSRDAAARDPAHHREDPRLECRGQKMTLSPSPACTPPTSALSARSPGVKGSFACV